MRHLHRLLIGLLGAMLVSTIPARAAANLIVLWPDGAPGAKGKTPADIPAITPYVAPPGKASGAAILVCPGGGYQGLSDSEGAPIAAWLNTLGISAFVLRYRLGPRYHHPAMLQDVSRALRLIRSRAAEWGIDPARIGVIGFSAGGHLASTLATHFDDGDPASVDPIERVSSRPALAILIYPVITMTGPYVHQGSKDNLLGPNPSPELVDLLSNEKQVTRTTPPCFLVTSAADTVVPAENSLLFASAMRQAHVPFELHLFQPGEHGFALGAGDAVLSAWPDMCAAWLRARRFIQPGHGQFRVYDVDGDGQVTMGDVVLGLRIASGGFNATDAQKRAADVDGNGKVQVADAVAILRRVIGF